MKYFAFILLLLLTMRVAYAYDSHFNTKAQELSQRQASESAITNILALNSTALGNNSHDNSTDRVKVKVENIPSSRVKTKTHKPSYNTITSPDVGAPVYQTHPINQDNTLYDELFEVHSISYKKHVFRAPITSVNIGTKQDIYNGKDIDIKTKGKVNTSISASYMYGLAPRFRMGPEIIHTTYNNKSNININDSFSIMMRAEYTIYTYKSLELYSALGFGLSFNTLNLIYTRLTISEDSAQNSFREYIVKPLINGSRVPHKTAYFYCSIYPKLNNLQTNSIADPEDKNKGYSEMTGDGFGICVYESQDRHTNTTITYKDFITPEKATSIPWFIGIGVDYNLRPLMNRFINFSYVDNKVNSRSDIGVSLGIRYFNNGHSTVSYKTVKGTDQYTIKYNGYFSVNVALFTKL